jgi:hypothetical protein
MLGPPIMYPIPFSPHPSAGTAIGRTAAPTRRGVLGGATLAAALIGPMVVAQYAPPPAPAPFAGFLNEALRQDHPEMNAWSFNGSFRTRFELQDGKGIAGVPGSLDFRENNVDNHNAFFMERIHLRAAYTDTWWSILADGRSSLAQGDERYAVVGAARRKGKGPESDPIDLHQAFVTVGNPKELPLSLKVGRQELAYADERFIGSFVWNNIGRVFDAAKLRWQNEWFAADFFAARPVIPEEDTFNVSNDYEWFSGVYATSAKIPKHQLEAYALSRNVTPDAPTAVASPEVPLPGARDIYTLGVPSEIETRRVRALGLYRRSRRPVRKLPRPPGGSADLPARTRRLRLRGQRRIHLPRLPRHAPDRPGVLAGIGRRESDRRFARDLRQPLPHQPQVSTATPISPRSRISTTSAASSNSSPPSA